MEGQTEIKRKKVYYNFKMLLTKEEISLKTNTCQFKWFKAYLILWISDVLSSMPEYWSGWASNLNLEANATDAPRRWRSPALMEFS